MLPPITCSPPNFLRPNRCAAESRPFLDEPTPFLCAMCHLRLPIFDCQFSGVGDRNFHLAIGNRKSAIARLLLPNGVNFDSSVALPMALCALVVLAALLLKYDQFFIATMVHHSR